MSFNWDDYTWPIAHFAQAMQSLAKKARLVDKHLSFPKVREDGQNPSLPDLAFRLREAGRAMNLEVDSHRLPYRQAGELPTHCPCLILLMHKEQLRLLALWRQKGKQLQIVCHDHQDRTISKELLTSLVCWPVAQEHRDRVDKVFDKVSLSEAMREKAVDAMLQEQLADVPVTMVWSLHLPPGSSFLKQLQKAGLGMTLVGVVLGNIAFYALTILAWWLVGKGALSGQLDQGWMMAWCLMILTLVPIIVLTRWWQGWFSIHAGALMKRRLLRGLLSLESDEMRTTGAGRALAKVFESQALENLSLAAGLNAITVMIELLFAFFVLSLGQAPLLHSALLSFWIVLLFWLGFRFYQKRMRWTESRIHLTHSLVEKMLGHRTRLVQEPQATWHVEEDQVLSDYLENAQQMDKAAVVFRAPMSRGFLPLAILGLIPSFLGTQTALDLLAVSIGGILLAYTALERLVGTVESAIQAVIAWKQVGVIYRTASKRETSAAPELIVSAPAEKKNQTQEELLVAKELHYRYPRQVKPVLQDCDLVIRKGDKILLEGPSGGGKSTLGSLLAGLRKTQSGLLLLDGFDIATQGEQFWRKRVVIAPQFQENYIFTATLSFNLLMGRGWPPGMQDFLDAQRICEELGLDAVIAKMPAGMNQIVGEQGWQLSHGEKSRIFLARALLNNADLVILDESFAALDPQTLYKAYQCVRKRCSGLMVIAHP